MNEKIKELAEEAGVEYTITKVMFLTGEEEIQKFAELIVRECAEIARGNEDDTTARQIESRFGVKE